MCSILLAWHFGIYILGRFDLITLVTTSHRPTVHMCDLLNDRCGLCSMRKCSVCIVVWGGYPKVNQNIQFQHLGQTCGTPNSKENPGMWEERERTEHHTLKECVQECSWVFLHHQSVAWLVDQGLRAHKVDGPIEVNSLKATKRCAG